MACDILTSKNVFVDKPSMCDDMYKDLLGHSFVFSPSGPLWKQKRKASAHAFYKDRLVHMCDILKGKMKAAIELWLEEIRSSKDRTTLIDITTVFDRI